MARGNGTPGRYYETGVRALSIHTGFGKMDAEELTVRRNIYAHAAVDGVAFVSWLEHLLQELRAVPDDAFSTDCELARDLTAHWRAARDDFFDDARRSPISGHNRILLAIDDADLRCVEEFGHSLRGPSDYRKTKPTWGPCVATIYRHYPRGFDDALRAARVASTARGEIHLMRPLGRTPGASSSVPPERRPEVLAQGLERNFGRRMSMDGWDDLHERDGLPTSRQLRKMPKGQPAREWHELLGEGEEYALEHSARFPRTAAHVRRVRAREALRSSNATETPAQTSKPGKRSSSR